MSKNVLFIAYYFPPTGGGGVQRATKFIKYLPFFGWKPVVLTVKNPDFDLFDDSLLNDIPSCVKVYKTYSFDPVRWYRIRQYGMNSLFDRKNKISASNDRKLFRLLFLPLKAIMKHLLNNFVLIPDDYIGWIPFAVIKGYAIIKKEKIDVIYATGKPWSSFLITLFLKFLTKKPYILDLRDPWVLTPYRFGRMSSLKRIFEVFWEKACFLHAEKIININDQICKAYIQYYPTIPSGKFTYITHGFDFDDFFNVKKIKDGKFAISFIGTFYSYESPDNLLNAVNSLLFRNPGFRNIIKLKFVGFIPSYVLEMIKELRLEDIVETTGYLPHRESMQHMVSADILLLLLSKVKTNVNAQVSTGKLFEYLASRRPILALIPDNTDAAELINKFKAGRVVDPDDIKEIENTIYEMYMEYKAGGLKTQIANLERFDRRYLTRQLADILDIIHSK